MTQITTPLPLDRTILISRRNDPTDRSDHSDGRLRRAITRLRRTLRWVDRGDPLAGPARRAIDTTGIPDPTR